MVPGERGTVAAAVPAAGSGRRLSWAPGDAAQCDLWFPPARVPLEDGSTALLPVLVITAAYSRFTTGRMIPTRTTEDLLLGSWELILALGRVPRRLIWDNETGIGRGGRLAAGSARLPAHWPPFSQGIERLVLLIHPENYPSNRLAAKMGFIREGVLRAYEPIKGSRPDLVSWSLLPSDPRPWHQQMRPR